MTADCSGGFDVMAWLVGFATFIAVSVGAQWLGLELYQMYWDSSGAAGAPIPEGVVQAVAWAAGGAAGFAVGKFLDHHDAA